jgi:succinate dehydrogenase/fumarate reductase flavoprotein subunit
LKGLFAAGMARNLGINPFTGWSIASSIWSGYTAGESASRYAQNTDFKEIDFTYLTESNRKFLEPMERESGVDPDKLVYELQKILFPVDVLIIMSEPRLKKALDNIFKLKEEQLPHLKATDVRTLIKSKETQTMMLSAEMTLRASIMRKETRENIFYREDFNAPDNKNWLKWILVEKGKEGEMHFTTQDIPFERYRFKP